MYETLVEGAAIALASGTLFALALLCRLRFFAIGVIAAGLALGLCWVGLFALVMIYGTSIPGLGLMLLVVFPGVEEAVRAICVYSILSRLTSKPIQWLSFAVGYAAVELLYKPCLTLWLVSGDLSQVPLSDLSASSLLPGSALLFLGITMSVLRTLDVPPAIAFFVCTVAHSGHNIAVQAWLVRSENLAQNSFAMAAAYIVVSFLAFQFLKSPLKSPSE